MFTFCVFDWEIPFLGTFWGDLVQKIKTVSLIWNLVPRLTEYAEFINGGIHFFCVRPETLFWGKFSPKNKNCQFQLKFGTKTDSSMQNSMALITFSVLEWKHLFRANLVQKVKSVSLSWNLVARLIRRCRIQWWCSLFLFYSGNTHFG